MNAREFILDLIDQGILHPRDVVVMLIKYMSMDDVDDCLKANEVDIQISQSNSYIN
jgi:hypothetical protein